MLVLVLTITCKKSDWLVDYVQVVKIEFCFQYVCSRYVLFLLHDTILFSFGVKRPACEDNSQESYEESNKRKRSEIFDIQDDHVVVYTDGACEKNGYKGAKAGVGVWFGPDHPL